MLVERVDVDDDGGKIYGVNGEHVLTLGRIGTMVGKIIAVIGMK